MSDGDTTPTAHAAGTADKSPCLENSGYVLNGKDRAISLDNISNNMGSMATILAKLYDPDRRTLRELKTKVLIRPPGFLRL